MRRAVTGPTPAMAPPPRYAISDLELFGSRSSNLQVQVWHRIITGILGVLTYFRLEEQQIFCHPQCGRSVHALPRLGPVAAGEGHPCSEIQ